MKYISFKEFHSQGDEECKIMVAFPDKDAIYLKCSKDEIGDIEAVKTFLYKNLVKYDNCRICGYKKEKK